MTGGLFRKRPIEIEAHQFGGSSSEVAAFTRWMRGQPFVAPVVATRDLRALAVQTASGLVYASPGDWIIKGIGDEFYPCPSDVFTATYEVVE